jgi:hypothetical protein
VFLVLLAREIKMEVNLRAAQFKREGAEQLEKEYKDLQGTRKGR